MDVGMDVGMDMGVERHSPTDSGRDEQEGAQHHIVTGQRTYNSTGSAYLTWQHACMPYLHTKDGVSLNFPATLAGLPRDWHNSDLMAHP